MTEEEHEEFSRAEYEAVEKYVREKYDNIAGFRDTDLMTPKLCIAAIDADIRAVKFIPYDMLHGNIEIQLAAVTKDGTSIRLWDDPKPMIQWAAVRQKLYAITYINPKILDLGVFSYWRQQTGLLTPPYFSVACQPPDIGTKQSES